MSKKPKSFLRNLVGNKRGTDKGQESNPEKYLKSSYIPPPAIPHDYLYEDAPSGRDLVNVDAIEIPGVAPSSPPPKPSSSKKQEHSVPSVLKESSSSGELVPSPGGGFDVKQETIFPPPPERTSSPPPNDSAYSGERLDEACRQYQVRVTKDPRFLLSTDMQWAVASRFEKREQWREAAEAYSKMGALGIDHPKSADGLLRASYLTYKKLNDHRTAAELLRRLIDKYPHSPQMGKAIKVLASLDRQTR